MIGYTTHKSWDQAIANSGEFSDEERKTLQTSRYSYDNLKNEIMKTPANEVLTLDEDIQDWIFTLRTDLVDTVNKTGETHIGNRDDSLILDAGKEHFIELQNVGRDCIDQLNTIESWLGKNYATEKTECLKSWFDWSDLMRNPLLECLRYHIPDDNLWYVFDQINYSLHLYRQAQFGKPSEQHLQSMWRLVGKIWERIDPELNWSWLVEDYGIIDILELNLWFLMQRINRGITLAISQRVFTGTCPACPPDYRT